MNTQTIPQPIAEAAASMLAAYVPGLTSAKLTAALMLPEHDGADLMTVNEAAAVLRVSRRTIERMLADPDCGIERLMIRGSVRLQRSEVLAQLTGRAA